MKGDKETIREYLELHSIPEPNSGCLLWTGRLNGKGYGSLEIDEKEVTAHRVSWVAAKGPIPRGLWVLHKCDVRSCINPDHLFLGTCQDNTRDMVRKNRHGLPKLTTPQVMAIRTDTRAQRKIAADYGVSQSLISRIFSGERWVSI